MYCCLFDWVSATGSLYHAEFGVVDEGKVLSVGRVLTGGAHMKRYYTMLDVIFLYELREVVRQVIRDALEKGMPLPNSFPAYKLSYSLEKKEAKLIAPILNPGKILAVVGNYRGAGGALDASAVLSNTFLKPASSIIGPDDTVVLPKKTPFGKEAEYRAGLCAVIGKQARNVSEANAMEHVFGYTICLDIKQNGTKSSPSIAGSFDTYTPIGPWIVTKDEVSDPQELSIKVWQNGELKQDGNTKDMVCTVKELVSSLSAIGTLNPGDLIFTGTPAGAGMIKDGDILKTQIDKIGEIQVNVKSE